MAKVKCPNGHFFDSNTYGMVCPLCNAQVTSSAVPEPSQAPAPAPTMEGPATRVAPVQPMPQQPYAQQSSAYVAPSQAPIAQPSPVAPTNSPRTHIGGRTVTNGDPTGNTMLATPGAQAARVLGAVNAAQPQKSPIQNAHRTTIRRVDTATGRVSEGRKLVGFLVCYSRYPQGKAFNIYEGRNYIGRDASCDVCIPTDNQLSGRHMSILYRSVDNKFKFRDEQSSNGTFINKELLDDGELHNYDIIRVGGTLFIFIAIPQIGM